MHNPPKNYMLWKLSEQKKKNRYLSSLRGHTLEETLNHTQMSSGKLSAGQSAVVSIHQLSDVDRVGGSGPSVPLNESWTNAVRPHEPRCQQHRARVRRRRKKRDKKRETSGGERQKPPRSSSPPVPPIPLPTPPSLTADYGPSGVALPFPLGPLFLSLLPPSARSALLINIFC